jgi:hypothetical protein
MKKLTTIIAQAGNVEIDVHDSGVLEISIADASRYGCLSQEEARNLFLAMGKVHPSRLFRRLEYLRKELKAERISYGELAELMDLAEYIDPDDVELREAAGIPEVPGREK